MTGSDGPTPNAPVDQPKPNRLADPPRAPNSVNGNGTPSTEQSLLRTLRLISGGVILLMIVLLVTADTLGRLFISPDFHASELILGSLIGALLLILGIEVVNRLPGGPK